MKEITNAEVRIAKIFDDELPVMLARRRCKLTDLCKSWNYRYIVDLKKNKDAHMEGTGRSRLEI